GRRAHLVLVHGVARGARHAPGGTRPRGRGDRGLPARRVDRPARRKPAGRPCPAVSETGPEGAGGRRNTSCPGARPARLRSACRLWTNERGGRQDGRGRQGLPRGDRGERRSLSRGLTGPAGAPLATRTSTLNQGVVPARGPVR